MFDWYFKDFLITNKLLFWIGVIIIILIIILTIYFIGKELRGNKNANK